MALALVLGAVVGLGTVLCYRMLFPAVPPLQAALDRLQRRNDLVAITPLGAPESGDVSDLIGRAVGASLARLLARTGLIRHELGPNLQLVGRSLDQHLGQKALLGLFGLTLPALTAVGFAVIGVRIGLFMPLAVSVALGVAFFFVPDLLVAQEADERRADFRHALGSFLDLVVISLAGGAGVESALRDAAAIGHGWAYSQLRGALEATSLTGETPWAALARLGAELGVGELAELAASVSLAGTEGARVRESLAVKATSLRDHALAEAEAEASTERMALPVALLFVGFLLLVGYPAVDVIISGS